ncbi:hypothetical protein FRD01_21075 [Microvenator marinus]|uniref:Tetratricopeptide repeat protein n=1 Tax=Microvenator marinus TaxID=2600177 RepID=A0A5B8XW84_9DELT|nr:hypothetical protein [Microvenator marinus]QED29684.1 hypothetical protein FRD01_21075 [Microvenator marinus]
MTTQLNKKFFRSLKFAIVGCVALTSPALMAQGMSFGEDEVEAVTEMSPMGKVLEEGKALYNEEKFEEASLTFWKVIQDTDVAAEAFKPEAKYELGKTLFKLKLYHSALQIFGQIVDEGPSNPYFLPTLRGLVLLTDEVPEDPLLMQRLAAYAEFFPNEVPERYRDRFAYLVGRHMYNELDIDEALRILGMVSTRSPDYAKARYISGVAHVANYEAAEAVDAFKEVLRFLVAKEEAGTLNEEEAQLLDMTNLGMARVFYSTGGYDTSLKYYGRISRTSAQWPTALFESSWAYFQMDLYNKALGNLLTINAPFFDTAYFPEGMILTAVLYFYNCKYDRVRYVLEGFDEQYVPIKAEIDSVVAKYSDDTEAMYKWLLDQRQGATENYELVRVVNSALNDQQVQRKVKLIEAISEEKAALSEKSQTWKSSPLARALDTDLEVSAGFARSDAGMIAQQRLERASRELENLVLEQKKIQFEVARAEKGEIEADLRASMVVDRDVTDKPSVDVSDEEMYWTFDGEYWRDELGFYVFDVNSECKR